MKFALINPAWSFEGSTYFGCQEHHYPLELLFAADKIREAGHESLLVDAQCWRSDGVTAARIRLEMGPVGVADA